MASRTIRVEWHTWPLHFYFIFWASRFLLACCFRSLEYLLARKLQAGQQTWLIKFWRLNALLAPFSFGTLEDHQFSLLLIEDPVLTYPELEILVRLLLVIAMSRSRRND